MKRRSFLAAFAPVIALAAPALGQAPGAAEAAERPAPAPAPAGAPAAPDKEKPKRAQGPTEITAQEAMLDNKANLAVFSGDVFVKSPEYDVNCDKLTIYMKAKDKPGALKPAAGPRPIGAEDVAPPADKPKEKGEGGGGIDTAIAEGNVKILQTKPGVNGAKPEKYFGVGKKAVFDNAKGSCTLTGWPRVQQSIGNDLAREIVSLEEGCVIVMSPDRIDVRNGRHTTRIIDESALGGGKPAKENGANGANGGGLLPR